MGGLKILDITNPGNANIIGSYEAGGNEVYDVCIANNRAYLANYRAGLTIINVTDPTKPIFERTIPIIHSSAYDLVIYNDNAFVVSYGYGVNIISLADPSYNRFVGTQGETNRIFVNGEFLYIADGTKGLLVVNY